MNIGSAAGIGVGDVNSATAIGISRRNCDGIGTISCTPNCMSNCIAPYRGYSLAPRSNQSTGPFTKSAVPRLGSKSMALELASNGVPEMNGFEPTAIPVNGPISIKKLQAIMSADDKTPKRVMFLVIVPVTLSPDPC